MILTKDHGNQCLKLCSALSLSLGLKTKNTHSIQVFMGEQLNVPQRSGDISYNQLFVHTAYSLDSREIYGTIFLR